ncbi:Zona pellucida-like domain family protein [Brugia pahangi]
MTELENEITTNCAYDVLNSINGESVKYANVGDRLIHKWSCESDKYGMLVHSCFVYESDSDTFQLVDNQGCITDHTLMDPLHYSDSLTLAYSVIPAFKFVDKLTIRFQCKVALCIKAQNGCEGISPPKCEYLSTLTSISKHSISKSPSPILSNILQSSLPQNIESLCEGMVQYKLIIANLKAYQI